MTDRTLMTGPPDGRPPIKMTYTNWRGETAARSVVPIAVWYGQTQWHPEPGWMLHALCTDKMEYRDFALRDCDFTESGS